jgi:ectoine hydroxylase-related dioxygenase (phytanoyl-CoA dioxygenase family)
MISFIKAPLSIIKYKFNSKKKRIKSIKKKLNFNEKIIFKKLKKNGFVVIPNYISKKECDEIIAKIDYCIGRYKEKISNDENFSDQRIFGSEIISKKIERFHKNKQIHAIGENYTGYKMKNLMTMANRVTYKKLNKGSGGGWHKDSYYNQFKSILYLSDVNNDNGPFALIENSHKFFNTLKIAFNLLKGYPNTRFSNQEIQKLKKKKIKKVVESAGTLILVDTSLIHRGSPLKSGVRYAITNYYIPNDLFENLQESFLPKFSFN